MPEASTPAAPAANPVAPATPATPATPAVKLAGKFETPEALEKGAREVFSKTGLMTLPESVKLVGEGGIYADHAALEAAYKNAEKLIGKPKEPATPTTPPKPGEPALKLGDAPQEPEDIDVDGLLSSVGLKGEELAQQFAKEGKLSDEAYKKLAGKGYSKAVVNTFMTGEQAKAKIAQQQQTAMRAEAAQMAGGEEQLKTLLSTAREFVPADEIDDISERLANPKHYKGAMRDLMAHHAKHVGSDGTRPLADGGRTPTPSGPAKDRAEFSQLMRAAKNGDETAIARIRATPVEKIQSWGQ